MVTVKQLRDSLALLGAGHDNTEVQVWLPGSRISLGSLTLAKGKVLVEGNVVPGSALDWPPPYPVALGDHQP